MVCQKVFDLGMVNIFIPDLFYTGKKVVLKCEERRTFLNFSIGFDYM